MNINIDFSFNGVSSLLTIAAWGLIIFLAYRLYRKYKKNVKAWRVAFIVIIGLLSMDFKLNLADTIVNIPILPLGVWLLYFLSKNREGQWERFRPYAWLGFFANLIFVGTTLISIPIQLALYPKDNPSTYFANVEDVTILNIHPSAEETTFSKEKLQKQLHTMSKATIEGHPWYYDDEKFEGTRVMGRDERFPYLVQGIESKWGSGVDSVIYLEQDGKGLLVTTAKSQLYYRFDDSLIKGGK
jgi:hypothetical protein